MDVNEKIKERVQLHEANKALLAKATAEKRNLNETEQTEFDTRDAASTKIKADLDSYAANRARVDDEERALGESRGRKTESSIIPVESGNSKDADLAFRAWCLGENASDEMVNAAQRMGFRHRASQLDLRALNVTTATQGQNSIPDELMKAYYEVQKWYGRVRSLSTVHTTSTGAPLPLPTVNDTANTGEIVADGGAITTTADPSFGQVLLGSFKYSSKAVIVSWELLQDSSINLPAYLGAALGTRVARKQNTDYTVGAGTTLPFGIVTQSGLGKTAAATNAITWDEVIDLTHAIDPAYRFSPSYGLMMNDSTAAFLRKLKDSQNRYLWEVSLQLGQPDRAFGVPVHINPDMASIATGTKPVIAGDFSTYAIREAGAPEIVRSNEIRVLNGQVVFLAFQRADGNLLDATAVRHILMA